MPEEIEIRLPPGMAVAAKDVELMHALTNKAVAKRDALRQKIELQCTSQTATGRGCGAWTRVGNLVYIQTHWYVPPRGCNEGDYWKQGEGQWQCPKCGHMNRLYATPEVAKLKHLFKGVKDTYD